MRDVLGAVIDTEEAVAEIGDTANPVSVDHTQDEDLLAHDLVADQYPDKDPDPDHQSEKILSLKKYPGGFYLIKKLK